MRPHPRHAARPAPARRAVLRGVQAATALLSVLVLAVAGYGWSVLGRLDAELVTSPVIGAVHPDGSTDILLVGLDSRTDARGDPLPQEVLDSLTAGPDEGALNTDTLILLRIPDDPARSASAVSIPRDSYVHIPGATPEGFGTHKINSAYARSANTERRAREAEGTTGAELEREAAAAGRRTLIATVEDLTGIGVDHYAEVDLAGFAEITSAVGGVPVCLNAAVDDHWSGAVFAAGPQTVSGPAALAFVRQRHGLPRGDLDRVERQQAFLAGLANRLLSAGTLADPTALAGLITAVSSSLVLDEGWDVLDLVQRATSLTGDRIEFRTIPTGRTDLRTSSDGLVVEVDPDVVRDFFAGLGVPHGTPPAPEAATTVDVLNGSARTGLAAAVADVLDDDGLVPGEVGNAERAARTTVAAEPGTLAAARRVAQLLGGVAVTGDDTVTAGRVRVVLGRDYAGPTGSPTDGTTGGTDGVPDGSPDPATDDAPAAAAAPAPTFTADGVPCIN